MFIITLSKSNNWLYKIHIFSRCLLQYQFMQQLGIYATEINTVKYFWQKMISKKANLRISHHIYSYCINKTQCSFVKINLVIF